MSRASVIYASFITVLFLAVSGCNQTPSSPTASSGERVRTLESRIARLEEDYRSAASTRDQARKQAAQLQEQKSDLEQQVARLTADLEASRSALTQHQEMVRQRTNERDQLNSRCERLKKGLQNLLGQDETLSSAPVLGSNGGL